MAMPPTPQFPATQEDNNRSRLTILTNLLTTIESKLVFLAMEVRSKQSFRCSRPVNLTSLSCLSHRASHDSSLSFIKLCTHSYSIECNCITSARNTENHCLHLEQRKIPTQFESVRLSLLMSHRRNPPQKAWTSGMNPITQRSTTPAQQNGAAAQTKPALPKTTTNQDMNASDRHANDRLLFLLGNFIVSYSQIVSAVKSNTKHIIGSSDFDYGQERRCILWNILRRRYGEP